MNELVNPVTLHLSRERTADRFGVEQGQQLERQNG